MINLRRAMRISRFLAVFIALALASLSACQPVSVDNGAGSPSETPPPTSQPATLQSTNSPIPLIPIISFEACLAAGFPVMESYPRQCQAGDGTVFIEDIGNELEKIDLIRLDTPRPNAQIQSPLQISGEARGFWYFEADFPIRLLDEAGNEIAIAIAQAQGDWMTEEFVPFQATLTFSAPEGTLATLVLEKDNPSGLPENADALIVPVIIK